MPEKHLTSYVTAPKRKSNSGLFWADGAAEKKPLLTAISMQLFGVAFSTFVRKKKLKVF